VKSAIAAAVLAIVGLAAVGCGATDNGGAVAGPAGAAGTASTLSAGSLHGSLPAAIAAAGTLKVGVEPGAPPLSSTSASGASSGLDIELLQAVTRLLGVNVTFVPLSLPAIAADVRAHQVDLGAGTLADASALRTGGLQFLDYLRGQSAVVVRAGNPTHVGGINDLCGRHVGVVDVASATSTRIVAACAAAGRPVQLSGPAEPAVLGARLASGQVEVIVEDSLVAGYAAQASVAPAELSVVGAPADPVLYGIAVANPDLERAVAAGLTAVLNDGTYSRILNRWGAQGAAVAAMSTDGGA
jgi:polar amino acid transport system substrate-binding protein